MKFSRHRKWFGRPRIRSFAAVVCLLLLAVSSYDAVHIHGWAVAGQDFPVAPHHCLLCLAAHLPLTVHAGPVLPHVAFTCRASLASVEPSSCDSATTFSLYTRPPPQA